MNYNRIGRPQNDSTWQGQLMWHSERARGIGGSEIAVLTGDSPWMTPFQLWEYKTSKKDSKDISSLSHIQRGILGEKIARAKLTDKYIPYTWVIENTPYRCSDDGYNKELNQMLEIKCMSASAHEEFKDNVEKAKSYSAKIKAIPIYYLHQCIWNLFALHQ